MVEIFNIKTAKGRSLGRSMIFETAQEAVLTANIKGYTDYLIFDLLSGRLIDWNEVNVKDPELEYYSEEDESWHRNYPW